MGILSPGLYGITNALQRRMRRSSMGMHCITFSLFSSVLLMSAIATSLLCTAAWADSP